MASPRPRPDCWNWSCSAYSLTSVSEDTKWSPHHTPTENEAVPLWALSPTTCPRHERNSETLLSPAPLKSQEAGWEPALLSGALGLSLLSDPGYHSHPSPLAQPATHLLLVWLWWVMPIWPQIEGFTPCRGPKSVLVILVRHLERRSLGRAAPLGGKVSGQAPSQETWKEANTS